MFAEATGAMSAWTWQRSGPDRLDGMTAGLRALGPATAPAAGSPTLPPDGGDRRQEIRKVAESFEAMFLNEMFGQMWASVPVDETFGGGHAEEVFRGVLVDEYGKLTARSGGLGIADAVERELIRMQETL